jgi:hypothetical protein
LFPVPTLRQRLEAESPDLYGALLRSWGIAQSEWLPAVSPSKGSYNSFPHFRNIERHLDALLSAAVDTPVATHRLSALELYLLLASVLFHDFGRVYGDEDHAVKSALQLPKHYAELGIPTRELALSLSRIALYHDPLTKSKRVGETSAELKKRTDAELAWSKRALRQVRLEPYGHASELYVGTLLALADHMDGSVRRAAPHYVSTDDVIDIKGAFRRLVSGTGYDPATYTLKTTLNGFEELTADGLSPFEYKTLYKNFKGRKVPMTGKPSDYHFTPRDLGTPRSKSCDLFNAIVGRCCIDKHLLPTAMFYKCVRALNINKTVYQIERLASNSRSLWPEDYLLAVVLNDLHANRLFLNSVSGELEEMGLPVDDWFLEFGGEVFNDSGARDCEPVLRQDLLLRVAREMWSLRSRTIERGLTSYEVLADGLRIENSALVGVAVRRIASSAGELGDFIMAGASGWRFKKMQKKTIAWPAFEKAVAQLRPSGKVSR